MAEGVKDKSDQGSEHDAPTIQFLILKWAVIVMGVLLVAGFAVVILTIVNRSAEHSNKDDAPAMNSVAGQGGIDTDLPVARGADITALDIDGGRLAVTIKSASGSEIAVIHIRSGKIIRRIKLIEK